MNNTYGSQSGFAAPAPRALALDRSFLNSVYLWMTGGLLLSGFTALLVAASPGLLNPLLENSALRWVLIFAQLGAVVFLAARIEKMSVQTARLTFLDVGHA